MFSFDFCSDLILTDIFVQREGEGNHVERDASRGPDPHQHHGGGDEDRDGAAQGDGRGEGVGSVEGERPAVHQYPGRKNSGPWR